MSETNFEVIIKLIALGSAVYLFLKGFIPFIDNLAAQGFAGFLLIVIIIWWLTQKN